MNDRLDAEMRKAFDALKREDHAHAPAFSRAVTGRPQRRLAPNVAVIVGALAIAAVAFVMLTPSRSTGGADEMLSQWRPPTDVLLTMTQPVSLDQLVRIGTSALDDLVPIPAPRGESR